MFGRATIRLGIGPHSSCYIFWFGEFILCFMNDNIIVECSINVNITIVIDYL